ncbi:NADPH-adrenodoxin reductase [Sorochytrium milnesiophthora]
MPTRCLASVIQPQADPGTLRLAVVGGGPAGFYTAYRVLKNIVAVSVDMFEALPVPFGLARYGVAPDHPEVKNVTHKFTEIAGTVSPHQQFRFFGNVSVGRDVSLRMLQDHYDAVVVASGAAHDDREFKVPGERTLSNILSARAFVGWYNGLPEFDNLQPDLSSTDTALVFGQGNVALDVARMLLSPIDALRKTDISQAALESLSTSKIKHVHVIGRRGPLEVAFTTKEVRELMALPDCEFVMDSALFKAQTTSEHATAQLAQDRARKRLLGILEKGTKQAAPSRSWQLDFLRAPREFVGDDSNRVAGAVVDVNQLVLGDGAARAVPTGETLTMRGGLVLRSIGYRCIPFPGLPFDARSGTVLNTRGKVTGEENLYVSGWLKRGPTGVIATTMYDAFETGDTVVADLTRAAFLPSSAPTSLLSSTPHVPDLSPQQSRQHRAVLRDPNAVANHLRESGVRVVDWDGYTKIDAYEVAAGQAVGKPREKVRSVEKMLEIAAA